MMQAEGRKALEQSLAIRRKMVLQNPNDSTAKYNVARSLVGLGDNLLGIDDLQSADLFKKALSIEEVLVNQGEKWARIERHLSTTYFMLAMVLPEIGKLDQALVYLRKGLAIRERLVALDPHNMQARRDLGIIYGGGGAILAKKPTIEAVQFANKSLDIFEVLAKENPDNAIAQEDVVLALDVVAKVQEAVRNHPAAVRSTQKAKLLTERLLKKDPSNARLQKWLQRFEKRLKGAS